MRHDLAQADPALSICLGKISVALTSEHYKNERRVRAFAAIDLYLREECAEVPIDEHSSLEEIALDYRTVNGLNKRGIHNVAGLCRCTADELLTIPNFGLRTVEQITARLADHGFHLAVHHFHLGCHDGSPLPAIGNPHGSDPTIFTRQEDHAA